MWAVRDLSSAQEDVVFPTLEAANSYIKDNNFSYLDYAVVYILDSSEKSS